MPAPPSDSTILLTALLLRTIGTSTAYNLGPSESVLSVNLVLTLTRPRELKAAADGPASQSGDTKLLVSQLPSTWPMTHLLVTGPWPDAVRKDSVAQAAGVSGVRMDLPLETSIRIAFALVIARRHEETMGRIGLTG